MLSDRRLFLQQSFGLAFATFIPSRVYSGYPQSSSGSTGADLIARMTWMNPPASFNRSGDKLVVRSRAKTDFWRQTFSGEINDNGHFFSLPAEGDFSFQAHINGQYAAQFDQAGLMVRLDAKNWMKCGTEFFEGQRHASVVFTKNL